MHRRLLAALRRTHRWRPKSHLQVWCHAFVVGMASALGAVLGGDRRGVPTVLGMAFVTLCTGGIESYQLSRRRDADTVADWLATRRPGKLPGEQAAAD